MAYMQNLCSSLSATLERSASLPAFQLAGHAANADFWVDEAYHCLAVVDGYYARFNVMADAQNDYASRNNVTEPSISPLDGTRYPEHGGSARRLVRGTKDHELKELSLKPSGAFSGVVTRRGFSPMHN